MKFRVEVARFIVSTKIIEVEAFDECEAKDIAKDIVDDAPGNWDEQGIEREEFDIIEYQ